MKQAFSYLERDGTAFPILEVGLTHGVKFIRVQALVDSGASFSVFRYEIAEYLGIPVERGTKLYLTGIGGRILGYLHTVRLSVGKKMFPVKMVFSPEFTVSFNLLGRNNFFLPFAVTFVEKAKKIILTS